jgi:hypothetical protein
VDETVYKGCFVDILVIQTKISWDLHAMVQWIMTQSSMLSSNVNRNEEIPEYQEFLKEYREN